MRVRVVPFVTGPRSDTNSLYLAYTNYTVHWYTLYILHVRLQQRAVLVKFWSWLDHCGHLLLECSDLVFTKFAPAHAREVDCHAPLLRCGVCVCFCT